jgi:hypothetical protein
MLNLAPGLRTMRVMLLLAVLIPIFFFPSMKV